MYQHQNQFIDKVLQDSKKSEHYLRVEREEKRPSRSKAENLMNRHLNKGNDFIIKNCIT